MTFTNKYIIITDKFITPKIKSIEEYKDNIIIVLDDTVLIKKEIIWKNKIILKKSINFWNFITKEYVIKENE